MGHATAAVNAMANAWGGALSGGTLEIYTGSPPASADDATAETLLAVIPLGTPAFGAAANGIITLEPVTPVAAVDSGTAGWGRLKKSDSTPFYDGAMGTSGTPFIIDNPTLVVNEDVALVSMTFTQPKS